MQRSANGGAVDTGVPTLSLALSLAGGVSGGCWSAGTLDFLVEALDAWEQARGTDALVPSHRVLLHAMAGTSAGAQAAALLAMGLRSAFAPVRLSDETTTPPHALHNPLYSGWVLGASAADLLDERDGCRRRFTSVLDGSCTDEIADRVLAAVGGLPQRAPRAWVADPLRLRFSVTNLDGIPLEVPSDGPLRAFRLHADTLRYALTGLGQVGAPVASHDELVLAYPARPADLRDAWVPLARGAAASGAFSVLLPERTMEWPMQAYLPVRLITPPSVLQPAPLHTLEPLWPKLDVPANTLLRFTAADGGILVNDPIDLARDGLPGAEPAPMAVVVSVHPLLHSLRREPPPDGALRGGLPHRLIGALVAAVLRDALVSPADAVAATSVLAPTRFLLAPMRAHAPRDKTAHALAGASLGGFGGYLDERYRRHDFQLGRSNAQWALRHELTLPEKHPLFAGWTDAQRDAYRVDGPSGPELPIVPLMPPLRDAIEPVLRWPADLDPLPALAPAVQRRLDAIVEGLLQAYLPRCRLARWLLYKGWRWLLATRVGRAVLVRMQQGLQSHGL